MDITYLGHSSFKVNSTSGSVVTDPFDSKMVGIKYPKVSADLVTISHMHEDHNQASLVDGTKHVFSAPGEYEVGGISLIGLPSYHDDKKGEERGKNTIFITEIDSFRICHLGDLGHKLTEELVNKIGSVDVLMVPVGGVYTIDAKTAVEVARHIDPRIIIPMHFKAPGMDEETFGKLTGVDEFTSEMGVKVLNETKLSIKPGDLPSPEEQIVVVLERK